MLCTGWWVVCVIEGLCAEQDWRAEGLEQIDTAEVVLIWWWLLLLLFFGGRIGRRSRNNVDMSLMSFDAVIHERATRWIRVESRPRGLGPR